MEIQLTNSPQAALVDPEDYGRCETIKWHLEKHGYVNHMLWCGGKPKHLRLHRFVVGAKQGEVVDHIDGNPLNCRRENLRITTQQKNCWNRRRPKGDFTSRFKGVRWTSRSKGFWTAQIKVNYRQIYLGRFDDEYSAARAYDAAAIIHFGAFARLNFNDPKIDS